MKVKVLKKFEDIHTKEIHKAGKVMDVTKKRFTEILKNGEEAGAGILVEEVKEDAEETKEEVKEETEAE